ncbi:LacI family DNA-binding transcriptional regulator [Leisingera sp.]|uniref:LacI family DNA-binding transcriptional regulator n=1 Tax=Leisingera sp. TaxID=1879318 RepID=UPI003A8CFA8B
MKPVTPSHASSHDVARRAGVSHMTVSRVFRSPDKVAKKTREHVQAVAREMGYVPSKIPRGLISNHTDLAAIIVPSLENSLFTPTIDGLASALKPIGCDVIVASYENDVELEEEVVQKLMSRRPVGIVLHGTEHTENCRDLLAHTKIPVIEIGDLIDHPIQSVVSYSNFEAAKTMTRHLIERGFERIAFAGLVPKSSHRAAQRLLGYQSALDAAQLPFNPDCVFAVPPGFVGGAEFVRNSKFQDQNIEAVFFASDVHAVGAILECQKLGIKVPQELAIAGFDAHEIGNLCTPSITSLSIPRREIGIGVGNIITRYLEEGICEAHRKDLGFDLIIRSST